MTSDVTEINPRWGAISGGSTDTVIRDSLNDIENQLYRERDPGQDRVSIGAVYLNPFSPDMATQAVGKVPQESIEKATESGDMAGVVSVDLMGGLPDAVLQNPHEGLLKMSELMADDAINDDPDVVNWVSEVVRQAGFTGICILVSGTRHGTEGQWAQSLMFYTRGRGVYMIHREGDGEPESGWAPEWLVSENHPIFQALIQLNDVAHYVRLRGKLVSQFGSAAESQDQVG